MIFTTQIIRLDGLILVATVDDQQIAALSELKQQIRPLVKKMTPNSEPRASIESKSYTIHYILHDHLCYLTITEPTYPKKLALTYLADIRAEFTTSHPSPTYLSPTLRPYAFADFERFLERTAKTYQSPAATNPTSGNLNRLNDELKDVASVMTKNIEDLLYRGDSLERMGDMSSRLREDSRKYKRAAVRINWELLIKQYGPFVGLGVVVLILLWWRFG